MYTSFGYILDPHSAIAYRATRSLTSPVVSLATAHYGKFKEAVEEALGEKIISPEALVKLAAQQNKRIEFPRNLATVERFILAGKEVQRWPVVTLSVTALFLFYAFLTRHKS